MAPIPHCGLRLSRDRTAIRKALGPSPTILKSRNQLKMTALREGVGEGGRNDPNIVCTYE
jgi:hypothetical protein